MIPDEEVERIREAADIVGVIGEFVELRRTGGDYRGPCPFHQGTHRNFSVTPAKHRYYCFVCHEGGDVFTFVQKRLGLDWPSSVRHVAQKSGLEVREVRQRQEGPDPRTPMWEANAAAAAYFSRVLWQEESARPARDYVAQRAIPRDVADRFQLGFAPREIGLMRAHLSALGIGDDQQLVAGLLVRRSEEEEPRPRFRQRLIFPILDASGRCVGFGGRVIGAGEPKYLNSAESPVFSKGQQLYNLHAAKLAMRKDDRAFVVEGYFDVVRLVVAGTEGVVAPLGTALTDQQAQLITRHTKNVYLLYDSDKAGLRATFRAGDALLRHGASVRVVTLPPGEDPDTFVRSHGAAGLEREVQQALDVFERKVQILERGGWFRDLQRKRKAIDHLLPTLRATADPVMRDLYLSRAVESSGVDRKVLQAESEGPSAKAAPVQDAPGRTPEGALTSAPAGAAAPDGPERPGGRPGRRAPRAAGVPAEEDLVRCMLRARYQVERIAERIGPESFHEPRLQEIFSVLLSAGAEAPVGDLVAALSPAGAQRLEALLAEAESIQDLDRTVGDSLGRLEERHLEMRNREIKRQLSVANAAQQDALLTEHGANRREIGRLREMREMR